MRGIYDSNLYPYTSITVFLLPVRELAMCRLFCIVRGGMAREFSKSFYHSKEWAQVRSFVLMRDKYKCQKCGKPAQEVHHKEHLTPANIWDNSVNLNPDNLISLCRDCHFEEHRQDKAEGKKRYDLEKNSDCREGFHFDELGMLVPD